MLETSTNGAGAGAAVEAAAAGREDQRDVGELGFGAGGRAAPAGVPDPELVEQAKRRTFTAEYKARILAEAEACMRPGEIGELLRFDHSDTLADHLRNAARAAQMRSRQRHVECLRVADSLFALTQSQYFPGGLAKRRSSAGFTR